MNCCGSGSHEPKEKNNESQKDHNHSQGISKPRNFLSILHWVLMLGLAGYFLWGIFK